MDVSVEIEGLKELDEQLLALTAVVARKQVYSALSFGLTPMLNDVRNRAAIADNDYDRYVKRSGKKIKYHNQPGVLRDSIRRWRINGLPDSYGVGIGIRRGKRKYKAFYWNFIEYGTATQAATPFIRPAFDAGKEKAVQRYMDKLRKNIDRVIAKQALEQPEIISEEG